MNQKWAAEALSAYHDAHPDSGKQAKPDRWKAALKDLTAALAGDPRFRGFVTEPDWVAALESANKAADSDAALAILRKRLAHMAPAFRGVMTGHGDPKPEAVLTGKDIPGGTLCKGDVAVLAGAGGLGKSTLALQWALAGALAGAGGKDWGVSGGMDVRAARSAILSYEDSARRIAERATAALSLPSLRRLAGTCDEPGAEANRRVMLAEARGWPLFGVNDGEHALTRPAPLAMWEPAWSQVADHGADLVIIDPAMSAYVADANAVQFVRLFLDALFAAAREHHCGVLLVAHSTKGARRTGKDRDATGSVAGSAAWSDAARGVLTLDYPQSEGKESDRSSRRVLRCEKANYSRIWSADLKETNDSNGRFLGYEGNASKGEIKENTPASKGKRASNGQFRSTIV